MRSAAPNAYDPEHRLHIVFPGGGGGHWLANLIYCLERNCYDTTPQAWDLNYHNHPKPDNISIIHVKHYDKKNLVFSTNHRFNYICNIAVKLMGPDAKRYNYTWNDLFNRVSDRTHWQFQAEWTDFFTEHIDLDYRLIFNQSDQFADCIFGLLDQHGFVFEKNVDIVNDCKKKWYQTCGNPVHYFDHWNNVFWLGWCAGVMRHLELASNIDHGTANADQVAEALHQHRNMLCDFTLNHMFTDSVQETLDV